MEQFVTDGIRGGVDNASCGPNESATEAAYRLIESHLKELALGFSVTDGTYPELFGLYSGLAHLPTFFPIRGDTVSRSAYRRAATAPQIPAVYSGDLAIDDEDKLNSAFIPPKDIASVVFTLQHHV